MLHLAEHCVGSWIRLSQRDQFVAPAIEDMEQGAADCVRRIEAGMPAANCRLFLRDARMRRDRSRGKCQILSPRRLSSHFVRWESRSNWPTSARR